MRKDSWTHYHRVLSNRCFVVVFWLVPDEERKLEMLTLPSVFSCVAEGEGPIWHGLTLISHPRVTCTGVVRCSTCLSSTLFLEESDPSISSLMRLEVSAQCEQESSLEGKTQTKENVWAATSPNLSPVVFLWRPYYPCGWRCSPCLPRHRTSASLHRQHQTRPAPGEDLCTTKTNEIQEKLSVLGILNELVVEFGWNVKTTPCFLPILSRKLLNEFWLIMVKVSWRVNAKSANKAVGFSWKVTTHKKEEWSVISKTKQKTKKIIKCSQLSLNVKTSRWLGLKL